MIDSKNYEFVARSEEYYRSLPSYQPFEVTTDTKQHMISCMDPRCEHRRTSRNKMQTPGGGYGIGNDRQLAHLATTGEWIDFGTAIVNDAQERNSSTLDIHYDCKFWKFLHAINSEMANPSINTQNTLDYWLEDIYAKDRVTEQILGELMDAAGVHVEHLTEGEQQEDSAVVALVRDIYPQHKNVHRMAGENAAGVYVVSHLTTVGQDQKNRSNNVQAYFDSLGAVYHDTKNHRNGVSERMTPYLLGGMMLRSAATRTVIDPEGDLLHLEVRQNGKKIEFIEAPLAALGNIYAI